MKLSDQEAALRVSLNVVGSGGLGIPVLPFIAQQPVVRELKPTWLLFAPRRSR